MTNLYWVHYFKAKTVYFKDQGLIKAESKEKAIEYILLKHFTAETFEDGKHNLTAELLEVPLD